jgi:L-aminopeptidase/D-esterase-like protein
MRNTEIPGIKVGHATDIKALTGCSVVLCPQGAVGGVEVRGGAPGTRETDLLRPLYLVEKVHAILLAGGSAYGLAAAEGVMQYLEEQGAGFDVRVTKVPIVPAAVIFDLWIGDWRVRPNAKMGYQACLSASKQWEAEGNVGAGTGATVGKLLGPKYAMKSGLGCATLKLRGGIIVSALMVVNALGDVIDDQGGTILAGTRNPIHPDKLLNTAEKLLQHPKIFSGLGFGNTTIGVVVTNAILTKEQANKMAQWAQDGLARIISPSHTMLDGDTIFTLATGIKKINLQTLAVATSRVTAEAVKRAVIKAEKVAGIPAARDLHPQSLPGYC